MTAPPEPGHDHPECHARYRDQPPNSTTDDHHPYFSSHVADYFIIFMFRNIYSEGTIADATPGT